MNRLCPVLKSFIRRATRPSDVFLQAKKMNKPEYKDVCDFENLYQAAVETIQDKKLYPEELHFGNNLEEELIKIQNDLIWHTYKPGEYCYFYVYDPKERLICAPSLRDRVIQSALCRVLERYIEPRFDFDSYACRKGKGTLAAANRAASFAKKYTYYAYFDIKGFFDNIPVLPLEQAYMKRFVDDPEIMWLLHTIFMKDCNGVGIKKGCRTSQLSANVYLNELDHFIRHKLKVKAFVRNMDDFMIFSDDVNFLNSCVYQIADFLQDELFLQLNTKSHIGTTSQGFVFVGYMIHKDYKIVRKLVLNRSNTALMAWQNGKIEDEAFYKSMASRVGHCQGTSSYKWYCEFLLKALKIALVDRNKD